MIRIKQHSSTKRYSFKLLSSIDRHQSRKNGNWRPLNRRFSISPQSHSEEAQSVASQKSKLLENYKIRSSLERLVHHYATKNFSRLSLKTLYEQSEKLSPDYLVENAKATTNMLLTYHAKAINSFRRLPYLVVLNPSISECYDNYLTTMATLLSASIKHVSTLEENAAFVQEVLDEFLIMHSDTLPVLSKGFAEVLHLMDENSVRNFLDEHLTERISMRLIAQQHITLTESLQSPLYEEGGKYNGVIKLLNIRDVIKKNAEIVNDIFSMKYDHSVSIEIDTNNFPLTYHSLTEPMLDSTPIDQRFMFPYIEHHLDYIFTEVFKNSFRSHVENNITDPVQVTVSVLPDSSQLEIRIRDKGKGIPEKVLQRIFDYSFTTFESSEGDSYKTLNVPPGEGGNVVAGMGYGLPLSKNYTQVFNDGQISETSSHGSLTMQTYITWGTDVYIKLKAF